MVDVLIIHTSVNHDIFSFTFEAMMRANRELNSHLQLPSSSFQTQRFGGGDSGLRIAVAVLVA